MKNNFKKAFSLIEISMVILIVGILIAGISKGLDLVNDMRIATARALTDKAPMFGMENLEMWLETTSENSLATGTGTSFTNVKNPLNNDRIGRWNDINPTLIDPNYKNHAVQGTLAYQPLYIQDGINGLPTLLFDGKPQAEGGDYFDIKNGKTNFIEFTIFIVAKPEFYYSKDQGNSTVMNISCSGSYSACTKTSSPNGYTNSNDSNPAGWIYFASPASNNGSIVLRYYARIYIPPSSFTSKEFITPGFTNNTPIIASVNHGKINASVMVSPFNQSVSSSTSPFVNDPNSYLDFRIGKQKDSFDRYFKGYLSEIILFGRSLNDQETLLIKNYLSEKWRIKL